MFQRICIKENLSVEDKSAGVYFIDLHGNIRSDEFKDYQEKILCDEYYSQTDELQWNIYLLLITDEINSKDKELIESNQKYARKYVFTENEFMEYFRLDREAQIIYRAIL